MKRPLSIRIKVAISFAVYMPIVGLTYIMVWLDRKLKFALAFPRDVEQLSQRRDWLISELRQNGILPADAVVDRCDVRPMDQTLIFRSDAGIIEIAYTDQGAKKTLKCFAKFAPRMGTVWNKVIFNLQLNHLKEIWFNKYFVQADTGIAAPRVYSAHVSALTGQLCLITEHMGDDIEYHEYPYRDFRTEHLDLAVHGMAALHARYWGDTSERMKYVLPIQDTVVYMFDRLVAGQWSWPARQVLVHSWTLMNRPQAILHGDSRIGNMMFPSAPGRGRYVLIDWQATRRGRAAFDLAYFLVLSLMTTQRHELERPAMEAYYRHLMDLGVRDYPRDEFEDDYRHGCLCTLVLLALPLLSGEASVDGDAALMFVFGMGIWRERLRQYFIDFDYGWMAERYGLTEQDSRSAIAEMIAVIDTRLNGILLATGSKDTLIDVLRRSNVAGEFDV